MANPDNDSVSRLNTDDETVAEFPLPDTGTKHAPLGLSVAEDGGEVWVACPNSDSVYVLDGGDGAVLARIGLPWGSGPNAIALSRDQTKALVTLHRASALAVLDVATYSWTRNLEPADMSPNAIAWTEDGDSAIVTHLFAEGEHPFLSRVDFSNGIPKIRSQIRVLPADPRHSSGLSAPYHIAEGGYLTTRGHPAQIPSVTGRNEMWLPVQYNNITEDIYTPDSTVQSTIRRLELNGMRILNGVHEKVVLTAVHVHDTMGNNPYLGPGWDARVSGPIDLAFSSDGAMVYLLHESSDDLVVMPSDTPAIKPAGAAPLPEITVGDRPTGLAVSPVTNLAYVYNQLSRDVSVVDVDARMEVKRIPVTPVTGERMAPGLVTGARLFHTSDDPRISQNNKVSCASCHINGEHDGRSWAFHRLPGNHGPREVPSLLGLYQTMGSRDPDTGLGQLHRSGDRDEVEDFEWTFQNIQMGGTGFLGTNAFAELGAPNAGRDGDLTALARYVKSLDPIARSPYRTGGGALSEESLRGATFFVGTNRAMKAGDAGCAVCHIPETGFVDFKFHDVGSRRPNTEEELNSRQPLWHVNTPTLVGVWTTRPYAGVSSYASTILDVLKDQAARDGSANGHGHPGGLTRRQLRDLEAFVLSIDGDMTADEVRSARDTVAPRVERVSPTSLSRVEVWFNESIAAPSAVDPARWRLVRMGHGEVPIAGVQFDPLNGDRVTLAVPLQPSSTYELSALGGIRDLADSATGGTANELDPADARNTRSFEVGTELTITLGASGYENLAIPVHDTAMVGPNLSTWSHDSVWLFPVNTGPRVNTAFARFDWKQAFQQATGVGDAAEILDASIRLQGEYGEAVNIEMRRTLLAWSDPATGNDWNSGANGAPTWRDHAHPNARWNAAGAARLGGTGADPGDYNGAWDLSARVDASVTLEAINEEVTFGGPLVRDAFRFWFDHPSLDYGYAFRQGAGATQEMKFGRSETGFRERGPVLTLTYELPLPPSLAGPTVNPDGSVDLRLAGKAGRTYRVEYSTNFVFWQELTNGVAGADEILIHDAAGLNGGDQRFYRATAE